MSLADAAFSTSSYLGRSANLKLKWFLSVMAVGMLSMLFLSRTPLAGGQTARVSTFLLLMGASLSAAREVLR
jgi:hypothetical protein